MTMKRMGIEFTFVDPDCSEEELNAAFRPNTKAVFGETIANRPSRCWISRSSQRRPMPTGYR